VANHAFVIITAGEVMDRGKWAEFCVLRDFPEWQSRPEEIDREEDYIVRKHELEALGISYADTPGRGLELIATDIPSAPKTA